MSAMFSGEEAVELLAHEERVVPALLLERRLPLVGRDHLADEQLEGGAVLVGEVARRDDAAPVRELDVVPGLGRGRHVGQQVRALGARDRERPDGPGLDLLRVLADARDPGADLVAEQRGERLAAARVGDVVEEPAHLGRRHVGRLEEHPREDVVGPAGGAAGDGDGLAVRHDVVDEVLERLVRRRRGHDDDEGLLGEARGDRGGVLDAGLRLVGLDRADHDEAHDEQRVGVGGVGERRETDRAAGAADVRDGRGAHEPGTLEVLLHRAAGLVPAPAGVGRDDDRELVDRRGGPAGRVAGAARRGGAGLEARARGETEDESCGERRGESVPRADGVPGARADDGSHVSSLSGTRNGAGLTT